MLQEKAKEQFTSTFESNESDAFLSFFMPNNHRLFHSSPYQRGAVLSPSARWSSSGAMQGTRWKRHQLEHVTEKEQHKVMRRWTIWSLVNERLIWIHLMAVCSVIRIRAFALPSIVHWWRVRRTNKMVRPWVKTFGRWVIPTMHLRVSMNSRNNICKVWRWHAVCSSTIVNGWMRKRRSRAIGTTCCWAKTLRRRWRTTWPIVFICLPCLLRCGHFARIGIPHCKRVFRRTVSCTS